MPEFAKAEVASRLGAAEERLAVDPATARQAARSLPRVEWGHALLGAGLIAGRGASPLALVAFSVLLLTATSRPTR